MDNAVLISPSVDAIIRAGAQAVAGGLVTWGNLDATQTPMIAGVLLGIASVIWSIVHKRANA